MQAFPNTSDIWKLPFSIGVFEFLLKNYPHSCSLYSSNYCSNILWGLLGYCFNASSTITLPFIPTITSCLKLWHFAFNVAFKMKTIITLEIITLNIVTGIELSLISVGFCATVTRHQLLFKGNVQTSLHRTRTAKQLKIKPKHVKCLR